jgi:hypothetical protein
MKRRTTWEYNSVPKYLPSAYQWTLHLAQWMTSNELSGKGSFCVPITAKNAGIPRSSANWIWASCSSLGAKDMVMTFLSSKYPPKLATPHPTSRTVLVWIPHWMFGKIYKNNNRKPWVITDKDKGEHYICHVWVNFPICDDYPRNASMTFLLTHWVFNEDTTKISVIYWTSIRKQHHMQAYMIGHSWNYIKSISNSYLFNESNVCGHAIFELSPTSREHKIVTRLPDPVLVLLVFH